MKVFIPVLSQNLEFGKVVNTESEEAFEVDTSIYSEERWEKHFPELAAREGLFEYIARIQDKSVSDRVKVSCMLKAIFCFIESKSVNTYKDFAQMFNLAVPEYTNRLISSLKEAFDQILNGSSVKN